uniref:Uncharacterized protein n=1 Tax=Setaria italica TaxID=4555 RepID=K3Y2I2_SETIT
MFAIEMAYLYPSLTANYLQQIHGICIRIFLVVNQTFFPRVHVLIISV